MKVRELVQKLLKCDQDNMVVVDGYEGGVDELCDVIETKIKKNAFFEGYFVCHDLSSKGIKVVYLPRNIL